MASQSSLRGSFWSFFFFEASSSFAVCVWCSSSSTLYYLSAGLVKVRVPRVAWHLGILINICNMWFSRALVESAVLFCALQYLSRSLWIKLLFTAYLQLDEMKNLRGGSHPFFFFLLYNGGERKDM